MSLYQSVLKPLLFKTDPERIHNFATLVGETLGNYSLTQNLAGSLLVHKNSALSQKIAGINFNNPVGLSAGFDYDGHMAKIMASVGFGFNTVGTVTARPYEGNPPPRLGRLPKSRSLFVNKGFKNEGVVEIDKRLKAKNLVTPVGVSIGSSNLLEIDTTAKAIDDYLFSFNYLKNKPYIKYFELNISCPNTTLPEPFKKEKNLAVLLKEIKKLKIKKPIFMKMANEISFAELDPLLKLAVNYNVAGVILANLVKDRKNKFLDKDELKKFDGLKGNFSGRPTFENSNNLIAHTYQKFGRDLVIIGCGGIFSAEDAYLKIKSGASLVQMITGMIFEGPQVIGKINRGLVKLFQEDGYSNISQAIGTNC